MDLKIWQRRSQKGNESYPWSIKLLISPLMSIVSLVSRGAMGRDLRAVREGFRELQYKSGL